MLNEDYVVCIFAGIPVAERLVEYVFFSLHELQVVSAMRQASDFQTG